MTNGWIKLHRKLLDWGWYKSPETTHFFIYLLLKASSKDGHFKGVEIKRGDAVIGRKQASLETGLSEQTIRTCITRLKSTNEITIKTTNKFTVISIVKFNDYQIIKNKINQQINQQTNQQLTNNQPTTNHVLRSKELKNKESPLYNIPPYIDLELWKEYLEMRKKIRKPATEKAKELAIKKLEKLRQQGYDPNEVLKQSILNSWQGLFPLKDVPINKLPKYDEDTEFICEDCKQIRKKDEREYGADGKGRCKGCHKKYLEEWKKEQEAEREKLKKEWENMTQEQREKLLQKYKKLNIPLQEWMRNENEKV